MAFEAGVDAVQQRRYARAAFDAAHILLDELRGRADMRQRIATVHVRVRACGMIDDRVSAFDVFERLVDGLAEPYLKDATLRTTRAELLMAEGRSETAGEAWKALAEEPDVLASPMLHEHVLAMLVRWHEQAGRFDDALESQKRLTALMSKERRAWVDGHAHRAFEPAPNDDEAAAFLAHDVRAPLGSIIALATESKASADCLPRVAALARRALSLADKFLALARLERVQSRTFEPVELGGLLDDVCESLEPVARQLGKRLVMTLRFGHYVSGDRESLQRAAINLIENALQATRDGGTVVVRIDSMENGTASISIRDQGSGMPLRYETALTGQGTARPASPGGRFGLAIVARIARLHHIGIRVQSGPCGTVVLLECPTCAAPQHPVLGRASRI